MRPPRLAEALLSRQLGEEDREFALGDLQEELEERRKRQGRVAARVWYWGHVVRVFLVGDRRWPGGPSDEPPGGGPRRSGARDGLLHDLRHAVRSFVRSPGFTLAALATLTLGIGATTAAFSFADWALLRPLPGVHEPGEVGLAWSGYTRTEQPWPFTISRVSHPNLRDLQGRLELISGLAGFQRGSVQVAAGDAEPVVLGAQFVSASYFDVLGARPVPGRAFTAAEDDPASGVRVAVISHRLWGALFDGDAGLPGREMRVNGRAFTVVGVAPEAFRGTSRTGNTDVWLPGSTEPYVRRMEADYADRSTGGYYELLVRRRPGVTWSQVEAELRSFSDWLLESHPEDNAKFGHVIFRLFPGLGSGSAPGGSRLASTVWVLMGIVGLVLLIASANVANLLVIRGIGRRGELAVRKALGATGGRLVRQQLVEGGVLFVLGALGGTALAAGCLRAAGAMSVWAMGQMPIQVPVDLRTLGFALATSLVVGLVFSVLPALGAVRVDAAVWLADATPTASARRRVVRRALGAVQLAATLTLLVGALLLARTLGNLVAVDLGFDASGVVVFRVEPASQGYADGARTAYYRELLRRLRADPGITQAALGDAVPFFNANSHRRARAAGDEGEGVEVILDGVSPGYFDTLGIAVLQGRDFGEEALAGAAGDGVVIGRALARRLFGDVDPVGREVEYTTGERGPLRVIGVVADARHDDLAGEPLPMVYEPFSGRHARGSVPGRAIVAVRARPGASGTADVVREAAASLDASLPVGPVLGLGAVVRRELGDRILLAVVTGALAIFAAVLAAVGLYGVVAVAAAERTREFGLRMALGADARRITGLVVRGALSTVVPGVVVGLAGALGLARVLESVLYGVTPLDPATWLLAAAALGAVTFLAVLTPARRAMRVDPVEILRTG